jgi:hypoxanthine phosphoribosyltransferase
MIMKSDPDFKVLLSRKKLEAIIAGLGEQIQKDYTGKELLLVGILKGSFVFLADLVRELKLSLDIDFVQLSSYKGDTRSSGEITLVRELTCQPDGRHILIVEDIVDTGLSLAFLCNYLHRKSPASLKICALLDKPARRKVPVEIDYLGLTIPDVYVVGYGMDINGKYRNLPDIRYKPS